MSKNMRWRIFKKDFTQEVTDQLKDFSRSQIVFFAGLCAVRALPFLGHSRNEPFSFWKDSEKQKYLYSTFNAIDANLNYIVTHTTHAAAAAAAAAADAYADAAAAYAAYAAAYADAAAAAAAAADAAARAANVVTGRREILEDILLDDLERIKTNRLDLLNNDLSIYGSVWGDFQKALSDVGCEYWAKLYADLFDKRFIVDQAELERRIAVSKEIKEQGAAVVAKFLLDLKTQGVKRLNEARIVILGDKGAGKTSLKRKLIDINAEMPDNDESTEGVDVESWKLDTTETDSGVNVYVWDFAGHVVTHAAHRFFLSERCVYLIVYDGRVNDRSMDDSLEYWLDHVKNYGGNSPVYIVVNKKDGHNPEVDEFHLKDKYSDTRLDVKYFSIKDDREALCVFRDELAEFIRRDPAWNKDFPALWFDMKEKLHACFKTGKESIPEAEFYSIAKGLGIEVDGSESMRKSLHALGICLWYEKVTQLNMFVLNPGWISYGVYKIINWLKDVKQERKHELWLADFLQIFSKAEDVLRYPPEKHTFLFNIMQAYELAYPIANSKDKGLVVPILLSQKQPEQGMDRDFPVTDSLLMRYKTENTLPPDTISRFIVRHHTDIQTNKYKQQVVWRRGVKLEDKTGNQAFVIESTREICLYVKGKTSEKYLVVLRSTLNEIFKSYQSNNPKIEYKITVTTEQEPVYEDDGTIMAYAIKGRLYLDVTTGKDINMTIIQNNYHLDKGAMLNAPNIVNSKDINVNSTINNAPVGFTIEEFGVLLDQLLTFLKSEKAEDELKGKDRKILQEAIIEAKKESDLKKGWNILRQVTSTIADIATILTAMGIPQAIANALA